MTGGGSFYRWEKVTIEAVADEGFEFAGWTGVDENYSKEPSIELEVHQNMEIRGVFYSRTEKREEIPQVRYDLSMITPIPWITYLLRKKRRRWPRFSFTDGSNPSKQTFVMMKMNYCPKPKRELSILHLSFFAGFSDLPSNSCTGVG